MAQHFLEFHQTKSHLQAKTKIYVTGYITQLLGQCQYKLYLNLKFTHVLHVHPPKPKQAVTERRHTGRRQAVAHARRTRNAGPQFRSLDLHRNPQKWRQNWKVRAQLIPSLVPKQLNYRLPEIYANPIPIIGQKSPKTDE